MGGPGEGFPADHFGTIAQTTIPMPVGDWRIRTVSDDGVRVWVNDELVIDNWTWHAPTEDVGLFTIEGGDAASGPLSATTSPSDVHFRVEHFELDGYAQLTLAIEKVGEPPQLP